MLAAAMGATFYTEPLLTFDLGVFVNRQRICSGAVSAPTSNPPAVIDRSPSVSGEGARGDAGARNGRNDSTSSRKRSASMALRQLRRVACELTNPSVLAARGPNRQAATTSPWGAGTWRSSKSWCRLSDVDANSESSHWDAGAA